MRLVHAIPQAEHLTGQPDAEFTAFLRGVARDKLAKLQVEAGVNHEAIVSGGGVASSVAGMARECGADLIVAGRGPSQDGGRRLGRQINAILLAAPCSLISL